MKSHIQTAYGSGPPHVTSFRRGTGSYAPPENLFPPLDHVSGGILTRKRRRIILPARPFRITAGKSEHAEHSDIKDNLVEQVKSTDGARAGSTRRDVLVAPFLAMGASFLLSAATRAEEKVPVAAATSTEVKMVTDLPGSNPEEKKKMEEEVIMSRIYDATVIGEPLAIGKDKRKVWEKLMNARVVYLGEAEQVPVRDDKELELEILKNLHKRCVENDRQLSLAFEAFPSNLQEPLNQYMEKKYVPESEKWKENYFTYIGSC